MEKGTPGFQPLFKTKTPKNKNKNKELRMALSSSPSPVLNRKKLLPRNLTIIQKFLETSSLSVSYKVKDNLLGDSAFLKVYQRSDIMSCYTPKEMLDEL